MQSPPQSSSQPLTISSSVESQVYALFALAVALTTLGSYVGFQFAGALFSTGTLLLLFLVEMGLIFTSGLWSQRSPLNVVLFGLFPFLSGLTLTPYLALIIGAYANGFLIILNALGATACMALAAAVLARTTSWNLGALGRTLLFSLMGLLVLSILQIFVPAFQTSQFEILLSGAGILLFSVFTAYDLQRIQSMSRFGMNPFLMALSLYLDIYNLFLMVLRLMLALSGNRR